MDKKLPKRSGAKTNAYTARAGEPSLDRHEREKAGKQMTAKGIRDKAKNNRARNGQSLDVASGGTGTVVNGEDLQKELKRVFRKE